MAIKGVQDGIDQGMKDLEQQWKKMDAARRHMLKEKFDTEKKGKNLLQRIQRRLGPHVPRALRLAVLQALTQSELAAQSGRLEAGRRQHVRQVGTAEGW